MKYRSLLLIGVALTLAIPGLAASGNTHTHVRFRFNYGLTFFGDVDVELFDQEKPVTVANFLRYLHAGAYEGTILHRCIPAYVLQGGAGTVGNAYSSGDFECLDVIPKFPPITNEFLVGPRYHNFFGTLAMAKLEGQTNSATSSWFFNLGDNVSTLDLDNGGFTVFGRVTAGEEVLRTFNTFAVDQAIVDMFDDFHLTHCPPLYLWPEGELIAFDTLPVGFFGVDCPRYNDLFAVQIIDLSSGDTNSPAVQILQPAVGARVATDSVLVTGIASDNRAVSAVWVYHNEGPRRLADGRGSWSLLLTNLSVGTNLLDVESVDASGNHSLLWRQTFVRVVPPPRLLITSLGEGTYCLHLEGVKNAAHRLEWASALPAPNWNLIVELTTDGSGVAEYAVTPPSGEPHRFYRVVCP